MTDEGRTDTRGSTTAKQVGERRRSPRLQILGHLHGHAVSMNVDVKIREISLGGMAIETLFAFPIGAVHEFRLELADGSNTQLLGRVVHCWPELRAGAQTLFITGVAFIEESDPVSPTVGDLIEKIK